MLIVEDRNRSELECHSDTECHPQPGASHQMIQMIFPCMTHAMGMDHCSILDSSPVDAFGISRRRRRRRRYCKKMDLQSCVFGLAIELFFCPATSCGGSTPKCSFTEFLVPINSQTSRASWIKGLDGPVVVATTSMTIATEVKRSPITPAKRQTSSRLMRSHALGQKSVNTNV